MLSKLLYRAACLAALIICLSCGTGDDDGSRLGEQIVGTWYRDSLVIEGDTGLDPEDLTYHRFDFLGDGSFNGMRRKGSFAAISRFGNLIYEGSYECDNNNLRLEFYDEGKLQKLHTQVVSFTEERMQLRYESDEYKIGIRLWLKKDKGE